jgi:hypothetical protein
VDPLEYESISRPQPAQLYSRRPTVTAVCLVISSIGFIAASIAVGFVVNGDVIGDAYAPLLAVVYGLPLSIATFVLVMLPVLLLTLNFERPWKNRPQSIAFAMAAISTAAICGTTLLCLFSPHTHGSGC